jgi:hypothetical protein
VKRLGAQAARFAGAAAPALILRPNSSLRPIALAATRASDIIAQSVTSGASMNYARIPVSRKQSHSPDAELLQQQPLAAKLRGIMLAQAISPARRWLMTALTRPLTLLETLIFGLALLVIGIAYCQVYCLLALQKMHGESMPLLASVYRAGADVIPPFLVFEAGKRVAALPRAVRWSGLAALLISGFALGVLIREQAPIMSSGLTLRRMAADRIPFMLLAAAALTYYWRRAHRRAQEAPWTDGDEREQLPPAKAIDWVKAAGNYVEIRIAGRTRLLRMTLRQARALLPGDQFVQIHRSVIVNRDRIAIVNGRRSVEMTDGTTFAVGDAHRSNLPES